MNCYLCGQEGDLTVDHVPPKGFFPSPKPSNLITVPCCKACNLSYSKDDEATRAWFSALIGRSEAGEWIFENKVITGIVRRSPAFRESLLSTIKDGSLLTEDGVIEAASFDIPWDRTEKFLIRCTKGLLHFHYPEYVYADDLFAVRHIALTRGHLESLSSIRDLLQYDERGNGVFQYRHGLTVSKKSGFWILVFYEAIAFVVSHSHNGYGVK